MKIFIVCSKHFYSQLPPIKKELESYGHEITVPNSFDRPFMEFEMMKKSKKAHIEWKSNMLRLQGTKVAANDAVLVLNFEKNGVKNYIGGATYLGVFKAFELGKKIFFYNPLPEGIFNDELKAINPTIINGKISKLKNIKPNKPQPTHPRVGLGVIIQKGDKILVGERIANHGSGTWMIAGGNLEYGESIEEGAAREAREETGLKKFKIKGIVSLGNDISYGKHYISIGVLLEWKGGEPYNAEPEKSRNWKWVDPRKLPKPFFSHSERVVKNWLAGKIYTQ